jgi:histone H1/5
MNFGFTGCHSSVPHLQRLAVYSEDALQELEAAVLHPPAAVPTKPSRSKASAPGIKVTKLKAAKAKAAKPKAAKPKAAKPKAAKPKAAKPKAAGRPAAARRRKRSAS